MKTELDVCSVLRLVLDAVDAVVDSELRRSGSCESQQAAHAARRARVALEQLGVQELQGVG